MSCCLEDIQLCYTRHVTVLPKWSIHFQLGLQREGGSSSQKKYFSDPNITGFEKMLPNYSRGAQDQTTTKWLMRVWSKYWTFLGRLNTLQQEQWEPQRRSAQKWFSRSCQWRLLINSLGRRNCRLLWKPTVCSYVSLHVWRSRKPNIAPFGV